jgi:phenylalanyl-tRNA synthetase beta subunit
VRPSAAYIGEEEWDRMMGVSQPQVAWREEKEGGDKAGAAAAAEAAKAAKRKDILSMAIGTYEVRGKSDSAEWKGDPAYFEWSCGEIVFTLADGNGEPAGEPVVVGCFGILHPNVLKSYKQDYPIAAVEMQLEPFL